MPRTERFRPLTLAAALAMFLLLVEGGLVRATQSGLGCPDWPLCYGGWLPPASLPAQMAYLHRALSVLVGLLALAAWWTARPRGGWLARALGAALAILGAQVFWGGWSVRAGTPPWMNAVHLLLALGALGALSLASVLAFWRGEVRFRFRTRYARRALALFVALALVLVSGTEVAALGGANLCRGWPLCVDVILNPTGATLLALGHRLLVGVLLVGMLWLLRASWRRQRSQTALLTAVTITVTFFLMQVWVGAQWTFRPDFWPALRALHTASAVAVWAGMVVTLALVGLAGRTEAEEERDAALAAERTGLARDLLMLTKPIVVALLLVTTYAGMVIGGRAWPALGMTFWTLLGGALAAGGSSAINQYLDREKDALMQRTQKRPIPAGRLTPAEGLAFGAALCVVAFYLTVFQVNLLAGLLVLAGIIYYVLIYSIFLKYTTVQNIVIGGGAGAIPPLVGWAAVTGSLNVPALFLFAVVFFWTPPHFWALALVRRKDYARAGVPMLPVVRGEAETRRQIFVYTLELVALTLLLPLFGLGGSLYLIGAALLGLWLIGAAYRVWKGEGNKVAWKMYRYSSMYLAFLFLVMMVDAVL